uniref:Uncharacterized protein n=1 Tax=Chromera velia CCMP2878 TaxID=1169474 RepID=A0A0G4G3X7_9ALVE|eukprot:Cvel_20114.t1-p1 / transcript=Cvel_20114.t1 / gene=Cvel_20114 / organism=Chromera_velia_CCMP2878 / gene_product=hypothetical protein / transcript_product=hypothetical protein / location=Cvel_scaffold1783:2384-3079(+) / protein_length=232 / sequence_SO=supercontig / SO=protein_coding / is_pseudo=false
MFRTALRRAAAAAKVPEVIASFGTADKRLNFVSHPGVMAIAKILEQDGLCNYRAEFTDENIAAIREFDPDLADKAQLAMDNKLKINMEELEHIDDKLFFEQAMKEKALLEKLASETMSMPAGKYDQPPSIKDYFRADLPRRLRKYLKDDVVEQVRYAEPYWGPPSEEKKKELKEKYDLDYDQEVARIDFERDNIRGPDRGPFDVLRPDEPLPVAEGEEKKLPKTEEKPALKG